MHDSSSTVEIPVNVSHAYARICDLARHFNATYKVCPESLRGEYHALFKRYLSGRLVRNSEGLFMITLSVLGEGLGYACLTPVQVEGVYVVASPGRLLDVPGDFIQRGFNISLLDQWAVFDGCQLFLSGLSDLPKECTCDISQVENNLEGEEFYRIDYPYGWLYS